MNFEEYQKRAGDTDGLMKMSASSRTSLYLAGLFSEVGEVSDATKLSDNKTVTAVREELGDVLWYVARLAERYGLSLDEIAKANLAKLKARYVSQT